MIQLRMRMTIVEFKSQTRERDGRRRSLFDYSTVTATVWLPSGFLTTMTTTATLAV